MANHRAKGNVVRWLLPPIVLLVAMHAYAQTLTVASGVMTLTPGAIVAVHGNVQSDAAMLNSGEFVIHGSLITDSAASLRNIGVLRFSADTAWWRNAAPYNAITLEGIVAVESVELHVTDLVNDPWGRTALGSSAAQRIGGTVVFERAIGAQTVRQRWWTNLTLREQATKTVDSGTTLAGEYLAYGGRRSYRGSVVYDGVDLQRITAEAGSHPDTNRYMDLVMQGGPKYLAPLDTAIVHRAMTTAADAPLRVQGVMVGGSEAQIAGPTRVTDGGTLVMADATTAEADVVIDDGGLIVPASSATTISAGARLVLADADRAQLRLDSTATLRIRGSYVNEYPQRTNARYHATSVMLYEGGNGKRVESTVQSHPYGHLHIGEGSALAGGDLHVASDLDIRSAIVDVRPYRLTMGLGQARYQGQAEVVGAMHRRLDGARANESITWNNAQTVLRFDVVPKALTCIVQPGVEPMAYDASTDVLRKVSISAQGEWQGTVRIGYTLVDIPATWNARTSQHLLRFVRTTDAPAISATKLVPTLPPSYTRRAATADSMGFVELQGLRSSGPDNVVVANGSDIVLRGSRDVLTAIAHGRWSNPFTWDEGREPEPDDDVRIDGVTVHVGFVRATDAWAVPERSADALASSITIGNTRHSALLIGHTQADTAFALRDARTSMLHVQRGAPAAVAADRLDTSANPVDGGLVVYPGVELHTRNLLVAPAATVINAGTLVVGTP